MPAKSSFTTKKAGFTKFSKFNKKKVKSVPPRQDALERTIRQLTTVFFFTRLLATPLITIDDILEVFKSIKPSKDLNNLNF